MGDVARVTEEGAGRGREGEARGGVARVQVESKCEPACKFHSVLVCMHDLAPRQSHAGLCTDGVAIGGTPREVRCVIACACVHASAPEFECMRDSACVQEQLRASI